MQATLELPALSGRVRPSCRAAAARLLASLDTPAVRPDWRWRWRQRLILARNGSLFVPALAWLGRRLGLVTGYAELYGRVVRGDGTVIDLGLLGRRVVTTAGVNFLASAFDNTVEPELLKFHAFGTGTTAEATTDTALVTELTTQYNPDNTRPTGSQAHSTNTYTTVGTLTPDSGGTIAVTEHMIASQAATGGGTCWDRTVFAAVNLNSANGDSLQATYVLTLPAGG